MSAYRIVLCLIPAVVLASAANVPAAAQNAAGQNKVSGDSQHGEQLFQRRCVLCHSVGQADAAGGQGPSLNGVFRGKAASAPGFPYTKELTASNLVWDAAALDRFLMNPAQMVPGTAMPLSVPDAADRRDLIAYLATVHETVPARTENSQPAQISTATGGTSPPAGKPSPFGDWRNDAPGVKHHLRPEDLPAPFSTSSARNSVSVVPRPPNAMLRVPNGFTVQQFASDLTGPRVVRVAPNGDIFVAETRAGRIRVLRAEDGADRPSRVEIFAQGLDQPFGIAFYPQGTDPQWIYVATNNSVVRFAYTSGDLQARGRAQVIVPRLSETSGGHPTRDIAFSKNGKRMFVSVGSKSNVADDIGAKTPGEIRKWERKYGLGAAWGSEARRADVLVFDVNGHGGRIFASGIRNCVGLGVNPVTGNLWCTTNERDGLGDDLVPDYVTRVSKNAFYGWPWYYIGSHEEPRRHAERPDLADKVTVPDVLLQAHSAALGIAFYEASEGPAVFPQEFRGSAFVTLHGSWNRSTRTGYKVVRVPLQDGVPTGEYEDFLTGFVVDDSSTWGRPVGVAVAHDGALLVSEDGNGTLWRITYGAAGAR